VKTSSSRKRAGSKARLNGSVAVVAGATRGAGRGIARALAEAGATVYCTGRSVRGNPSPYGRPETIEETAEMISADGGTAIAVRVDHTIEPEVERLFARIADEQGRVDIVVNCIAGEDPLMKQWGDFWTADLRHAETILRQSLVSHFNTAQHAALATAPGLDRRGHRERHHRCGCESSSPNCEAGTQRIRPDHGHRASCPWDRGGRHHARLSSIGGNARASRRHRR
jgi:NAD(P)-dependent dehydrogenase (short-subunit alcohol dehydrogenase family)